MTQTIVAVTGDLMTAAPIEHAARQAGAVCRVIASADAPLPDAPSVRLVVVDLSSVTDIASTVATLRQSIGDEVPVVAFGPHVHEELLASAQTAGCNQVLTRGQFHRNAGQIVAAAVNA